MYSVYILFIASLLQKYNILKIYTKRPRPYTETRKAHLVFVFSSLTLSENVPHHLCFIHFIDGEFNFFIFLFVITHFKNTHILWEICPHRHHTHTSTLLFHKCICLNARPTYRPTGCYVLLRANSDCVVCVSDFRFKNVFSWCLSIILIMPRAWAPSQLLPDAIRDAPHFINSIKIVITLGFAPCVDCAGEVFFRWCCCCCCCKVDMGTSGWLHVNTIGVCVRGTFCWHVLERWRNFKAIYVYEKHW